MNAKAPLPIIFRCNSQERHTNVRDLLNKGIMNGVFLEKYLPNKKIRPDITCMAGDKPKVLIEVVDTHRPEKPVINTRLPVLEVHVSKEVDWRELAEGPIPVAVMHNYTPCAVCRQLEQRRQEAEHQMLEKLRDAGLRYRTGSLPPIAPIKQDKYKSFLQPNTRSMVNSTARSLQRMGFNQCRSRPTLFSLTVIPWNGGKIQIFADLDSTDTIPLWKHLEWEHTIPAALYAFPEEHPLRDCALKIVADELDQHGISHRRHFSDLSYW